MYSEVVNGLGFSQSTLEVIVLFGIIVVVMGIILVLYWKYLVMGTLALVCVAVMANHKPTVKEKVEVKEEVINQVKPSVKTPEPINPHVDLSEPKKPSVDLSEPKKPSVDLSEKKDIRSEFMERCINLADYTRTQCDELWDDRVQEERELLLDTKNKGKKHGHYRKV